MLPLVTSPVAQALAWSLVHFLWQGAAIAALAVLVQRFGGLTAAGRYVTGVVAMAAMLAAPIATFAYLNATAAPELPPIQSVVPGPATPVDVGFVDTSSVLLTAPVPPAPPPLWTLAPAAMLVIWGVGVIVLSMRLFGGWLVARRLTRHASMPAREEIQVLARRVAARLALDRIVRVCESTAVVVPVMIGWMKPVVLLPATALAGLSVEQVEALLAHELAHVRRHDYLVNLLQSAIETLLFYHPAVWWVSARVRTERELCCDDIAVGICDRVVYATALTDLATMASTPRLALAATDGPLLHRVRRILGQSAERAESGSGWLVACAVVLLVGTVTPAAVIPAPDQDTTTPEISQVSQPAQTAPAAPAEAQELPPTKPKEQPREVRPEPVQAPTELMQTAEARAAEQEKARKVEDALRMLARERADNEAQRAIVQAQARVEILQSQMDLIKQQLARTQQQVQTGIVGPSAAFEVEVKLRETQQRLLVERSELEYQQRERQLRQREIELGLARNPADPAAMTRADLEKMVAEKIEMARAVEAPALAANETAQAGDTLTIVIQSEPDLPKAFVIHGDGTIRFPFVGAIKVLGMTAAQAREAVTKQLTDRKLATGSGIEVTLRRPRAGGR